MRWKLLVATSLVAAVGGAGASYGLVYALFYFSKLHPASPAIIFYAQLPPLVTSASAGFFVYRHTARRRKLQTLMAVLLSLVLAVTLIRYILPHMPYFNTSPVTLTR